MAANVETMFSIRNKPWHGLGRVVTEAPTSREALKLAGLDWNVVQEPIYTGLADCGLPNIRWHDLRSTYSTLLLKENFNPKAVSLLLGHASEVITIDVYGENRNIIADGIPEIEEYMREVLPDLEQEKLFQQELLDIVVDVSEYLSPSA